MSISAQLSGARGKGFSGYVHYECQFFLYAPLESKSMFSKRAKILLPSCLFRFDLIRKEKNKPSHNKTL